MSSQQYKDLFSPHDKATLEKHAAATLIYHNSDPSLSQMGSLPKSALTPQIFFGTYELGYDDIYQGLLSGYRAIDTAQTYGNEADVGRAVRDVLASSRNTSNLTREDVTIVSKLARNVVDYDTAYRAIVESVERIGLGYIDMFLLHTPYGGEEAVRTAWRAVEDAVGRGLIRHAGVSNFLVPDIERLLGWERKIDPVVNQLEIHPFYARSDVRECCAKNGIGIQAYGCLARGQRMKHSVVAELAGKYECTPGQLLIKWSLQLGMSPVTKSARPERAAENLQVNKHVISEEHMRLLNSLDEGLEVWDLTPYKY